MLFENVRLRDPEVAKVISVPFFPGMTSMSSIGIVSPQTSSR